MGWWISAFWVHRRGGGTEGNEVKEGFDRNSCSNFCLGTVGGVPKWKFGNEGTEGNEVKEGLRSYLTLSPNFCFGTVRSEHSQVKIWELWRGNVAVGCDM